MQRPEPADPSHLPQPSEPQILFEQLTVHLKEQKKLLTKIYRSLLAPG